MPDGRIRPHHRRRRRFDHGRPIAAPGYVTAAAFATCLAVALLPFLRAPTHAVVIELPVSNGFSPAPEAWPPDVVVHRVALTPANEILWNYELVTQPKLVERLRGARIAEPRPGIVFAPEPLASYDLAAKVLNLLAKEGVTKERFCLGGLSQHGVFGREPSRYRLGLTMISPVASPEQAFRPAAPPECGPPRGRLEID